MKAVVTAVALACVTSCANDSPVHDPGTLTAFTFFGNAGCFAGQITDDTIAMTAAGSCTQTDVPLVLPASGTLTAAGQSQLAELIAALPIDGPVDPPNIACNDSGHLTVDVDFIHGGPRSYTIDDCATAAFAALDTFVFGVGLDIGTGSNSADVVAGSGG